MGRRWSRSLRQPDEWLRSLPVDPDAIRYPEELHPTRFGRAVVVSPEHFGGAVRAVVTGQPAGFSGRFGPHLSRLRRLIVGPPLMSSAIVEERMRKLVALPVLSSDLVASVAYGPEAMLGVLVLAGSGALGLSLPIAAALVALMITVGVSYRQTLRAYPDGAGSYLVAGDNLGHIAGLAAAAGLIGDYVLNVAVSIATGVASVVAALPQLQRLSIPMGLAMFALLLAGNLRGVRQAGALFAAPTYAFLAVLAALVVAGLAQAAGRGFTTIAPPPTRALEGVTALLVLRAFASGATAMTGIEAVSNAVPSFQPPEWRNGRTTLTWMMAILVLAFTGVVALLHLDGIAPRPDDTVLSQLARHVFGGGALYGGVQLVTVMILLFGANTSYNDFPRLLYLMARDSYAPHAFLRMGDRLAFSNGVIFLTLASLLVYLAFSGNLQPLIPLFAVGVFLAFTLSQAGMVRRWWTRRGRGWRSSLALNAAGAVLSAVVLVTAATTKLLEGAWVVVLGVPVVVVLCLRIRAHYDAVREALRLRVDEDEPELEPGDVAAPTETPASRRPPAAAETQDVPDQLRHLVLVPVSRLDLANLRALSYAASLRKPLLALHISPGTEEAERFSEEWRVWGGHLPVVVVISPYRALLPPLITYIQALHRQAEDVTITVAVPEMVVHRAWHRLLHNQVVSRLRRALRRERGVVVTSVPVHLPAT